MNDFVSSAGEPTIFSYIFFYMLLFSLGACLGSFYMLIGERVPRKEDIVKTRSHCTNCNHSLGILELIPILSYILLRGKCKNCQSKINPIYPLFECLTGFLFCLTPLLLRMEKETFIGLTLLSLLLIITVTDVTSQLIPNKILIPFFILAIIERGFVQRLSPWWYSILGFLIGFFGLYILALLSKGGMGGGDMKLFGVLGVFLGPKYVMISFVLTCILALIFIIAKMVVKRKRIKYVPLGPFIAIATWLVYMHATNQFGTIIKLIFY